MKKICPHGWPFSALNAPFCGQNQPNKICTRKTRGKAPFDFFMVFSCNIQYLARSDQGCVKETNFFLFDLYLIRQAKVLEYLSQIRLKGFGISHIHDNRKV
jgi:hypothetical protein